MTLYVRVGLGPTVMSKPGQLGWDRQEPAQEGREYGELMSDEQEPQLGRLLWSARERRASYTRGIGGRDAQRGHRRQRISNIERSA